MSRLGGTGHRRQGNVPACGVTRRPLFRNTLSNEKQDTPTALPCDPVIFLLEAHRTEITRERRSVPSEDARRGVAWRRGKGGITWAVRLRERPAHTTPRRAAIHHPHRVAGSFLRTRKDGNKTSDTKR